MKTYFFLTTVFSLFVSQSCSDFDKQSHINRQSLVELEAQYDSLKVRVSTLESMLARTIVDIYEGQGVDNTQEGNSTNSKYIFLVVEVSEPVLVSIYLGGEYLQSTDFHQKFYTTSIEEVNNPSESKKLMLLDEFEDDIRRGFFFTDNNYRQDVQSRVLDRELRRILIMHKSRIVSRDCYLFSTYRAASEKKHEFMD